MITNPSTLGLFESRIGELLDAVHEVGALAYMDGANLNAILGRFKPGEAGFDVMHINTHKTFSTPHGGGGPGAGPVGGGREAGAVPARAARPARGRRHASAWSAPGSGPTSIGRVRSFIGSTGVLVRAYAYICAHGGSGLARGHRRTRCSPRTTCKAASAPARTTSRTRAPCKHEFVASATSIKKKTGVRTLTSPSGSSTTASTRPRSTSR